MLTVTGILTTPAGQALAHATVRFYALETSTTVLKGSTGEFTTDAAGAYSVDLEPGYHRVTVQLPRTRTIDVGRIHVTESTQAVTLNELLLAEDAARIGSPMSDLVLQGLAGVEQAKSAAEGAAQEAQQHADTASATVAQETAAAVETAESFANQAYTYMQGAAANVAYQDLAAILETKGITGIVDICVYNTALDTGSDAWRYNRKASWYNEPLNTATRGSRREFPAVAVVVAESTKVTIYDGDDPSLPMWIVINAGTDWVNRPKIAMLNGLLLLGQSTSAERSGLWLLSFTRDIGGWQWGLSAYIVRGLGNRTTIPPYGFRLKGISSSALLAEVYEFGSSLIVNKFVNDVAMTVLPNAPIDPATGLQIPTIAVATDGGVSVIKDDGSVISKDTGITPTFPAHNQVANIENTDEGFVLSVWNGASPYNSVFVDYDLNFIREYCSYQGSETTVNPIVASKHIAATGNTLFVGAPVVGSRPPGLAVISVNPADVDSSSTAHITSSSNTGWMHGDCKLAALCDTETGSISATDISTDTSFLFAGGPGVTFDGATVTFPGGTWGYEGKDVTTVVGKTYELKIAVSTTDITGNWYVKAFDMAANEVMEYKQAAISTNEITLYFTATTTTTRAFAQPSGQPVAGATLTITALSIKEVTPDRSGNNNHLNIIGTLDRQPIGNGEIAAWSGFSDSYVSSLNYLGATIPELNIGTDDFYIHVWVQHSGNAGNSYVFGNNKVAGTDAIHLAHRSDGTYFLFAGSNTAGEYLTGVNAPSEGLVKIDCVRRSGVLEIYFNGALYNSVQNSKTINASLTEFQVGLHNSDYVQRYRGAILELRFGLTAPTADQIAKMYRDEMAMIQGKATLYGSSDAVTALAHDPVTDLLHVGTSDGRSVFDGLTRVDQTTDPVTAAISAVDGFVVEG